MKKRSVTFKYTKLYKDGRNPWDEDGEFVTYIDCPENDATPPSPMCGSSWGEDACSVGAGAVPCVYSCPGDGKPGRLFPGEYSDTELFEIFGVKDNPLFVPNQIYEVRWSNITFGECAEVETEGCPCPDIQNMINAANKELYDAFVQWNGNRRTAKIELVKTLTEAMGKGNQDKFDKLSKEISDLKDKIWGG